MEEIKPIIGIIAFVILFFVIASILYKIFGSGADVIFAGICLIIIGLIAIHIGFGELQSSEPIEIPLEEHLVE